MEGGEKGLVKRGGEGTEKGGSEEGLCCLSEDLRGRGCIPFDQEAPGSRAIDKSRVKRIRAKTFPTWSNPHRFECSKSVFPPSYKMHQGEVKLEVVHLFVYARWFLCAVAAWIEGSPLRGVGKRNSV